MSFSPPISPARSQFVANVNANIPLCREHWRLVLSLPYFPPTEPGQFIQVSCRDLDINYSPEQESEWMPGCPPDPRGLELLSPLAMLRRPFSLAGRRNLRGSVELDLIQRVIGVGTDWLSRLKTGDNVHILGPLGNRLQPPPLGGCAFLVGGGVGIPPMLYLAQNLKGRRALAFCGAMSRDLLPFTITGPAGDGIEDSFHIAEFAGHGIPAIISTDDGSYGFRGYITQALEQYLTRWLGDPDNPRPILYTCGPEAMMKRVADIAARHELTCQVAVERAMACGMGTCQSCAIKVKASGRPDGRDWVYKLACTDGPVFLGADLLW